MPGCFCDSLSRAQRLIRGRGVLDDIVGGRDRVVTSNVKRFKLVQFSSTCHANK